MHLRTGRRVAESGLEKTRELPGFRKATLAR
jgi:hypothetical protein